MGLSTCSWLVGGPALSSQLLFRWTALLRLQGPLCCVLASAA